MSSPVPSHLLKGRVTESWDSGLSDQARLIELMQVLTYIWSTANERSGGFPPLVVLLTCWDEMDSPGKPIDELCSRLPMFVDFVASNWEESSVLGLSALGRALDKKDTRQGLHRTEAPSDLATWCWRTAGTPADLTHPIRRLIASPA